MDTEFRSVDEASTVCKVPAVHTVHGVDEASTAFKVPAVHTVHGVGSLRIGTFIDIFSLFILVLLFYRIISL